MNKRNSKEMTSPTSIFCIDVGNSAIKCGLFNGNRWLKITTLQADNGTKLKEILSQTGASVSKILVSSVVEEISSEIKALKLKPAPRFASVSKIPSKKLNYKTPETLGIDRYLACLGAFEETDHKAVIVIDAGTACTIDFMDANGIYQGGIIMPGLKVMETGLSQYAGALPKVERKIPGTWPGRSTAECLQWGLTGTFLGAIKQHLYRFKQEAGDYNLFITGGDAEIVKKNISEKAVFDQLLVLKGLVAFYSDQR